MVPTYTWSEKKTAQGAFRDHFVHLAALRVDGGDNGLEVILHDGTDATGPEILRVSAAADEVVVDHQGGVPYGAGKVFAEIVGTVAGTGGYQVGVA